MTNTYTLKTGKTQFNATSAKTFRATLAKWHNADFDIADALLQKGQRVSALRVMLKTNNELIKKLENGESIIGNKTIEELMAETGEYQRKIDVENAEMEAYRRAQKSRLDAGTGLLSDSMYNAYAKGEGDYMEKIAEFLTSNGLEPCEETVASLALCCAEKAATARQKSKTGLHNAKFGKTQWQRIFLGHLCDLISTSLGGEWLYKFKYKPEDKKANK